MFQQAHHALEQNRLARTAAPEDGKDGPGLNLEADIPKDSPRTKGLAQVPDLQKRGGDGVSAGIHRRTAVIK
jgi:hypothetical protein